METPSMKKITVKSVRKIKLDTPIPVYDATMPEHHNFCLGNGVVVHNTSLDARDANYQEVMSGTGKPLNALKAPLHKVLAHKDIQVLLQGLGADIKSLDPKAERPTISTDNLRVGNVIFLTDSDPDGGHIAVLFLTVLYRLIPDLFKEGRVWCVDAPLYAVLHNGELFGGMTFDECRAAAPKAVKDKDIVRIKGWGEVDETFLEPIAFNPKTRKMIQINPFKNPEQEQFFRGIVAEDASYRRKLLGLED